MATNSMDLLLRIRAQQDSSAQVIPHVTQTVNQLGAAATHTTSDLNSMGMAGVNAGTHVAQGAQSAVAGVNDIPPVAMSAAHALNTLGAAGQHAGAQVSAGGQVGAAGLGHIQSAALAVNGHLHGVGAAGAAAGGHIGAGAVAGAAGLGGLSTAIGSVSGLLVGLAGVGTIAALGNEVFQTNAEFQSLRTSLVSTTKSAENAALAFGFIQDFAAQTPFDVGQVTESFIKLANLGLKPSEEALRSYGNTSAAQGKPIMQMIEAVADAATGEFERLKEFGIKARAEGDKVAFTFAGATTVVGNSAAEIERYLIDLGNSKFGDAMAAQAGTIKGSLSNLGDTWDQFMDNLWDANTENAIAAWVKTAGDALHWLDVQINGTIRSADKLAEIDAAIVQKRASLAAHNDNGWLGSMLDDLTGYDPNLVLNQIDAQVKARETLIKTMGEQKKAQSDMINGLGKTGENAGAAENKNLVKIMDDLVKKNQQLTLSERDNFIVSAQAQGLKKQEIDTALALFDANARAETAHKAATDAQKKHHQAANESARQAAQIQQEYERTLYQMEKEIALRGDTTRAASLEYDYKHGLLDKYGEAQALLLLQDASRLDNWNIEEASIKKDIGAMEGLIDQYQKLTLSARDYFIWSQNKPKLNPEQATPELQQVQFDKNTQAQAAKDDIEKAQKAVDGYNQSLETSRQSLQGLNSVSSSFFDAQLGGINALVGAWSTLSQGIGDNTKAMEALTNAKADNIKANTVDNVLTAEGAANAQRYAKEEMRLGQEKTALEIDGARQMAGAAAQMFGEKSAAAKAFHAIETGLAVASMAMKVQEIAISEAATAAKVAEGAATFFAESGWLGFAGVAAMVAVMASLGYAAAGGFSSHAAPPPSSPDTGSVLGDTTKQSESVANIVKTLNDIHAAEYTELRGINLGIGDLQIALGNSITTLFRAGGLDTSNRGINLRTELTDTISNQFTTFSGILSTITLGLGAILFSGGYKTVTERGIQIDPQAIGELINGAMLDAVQYNVVKIRSWDLFSDSTKYETVFNSLDNKVTRSLTAVYQNVGNVSLGLAEALGGDLANQVRAYKLPELKIDLTDLNAEDASKKLNAVISTALDDMAETVFGKKVGQYQQLGEGMLETAARVVAEMAVVKDALHQSGLTMGKDAMAVSDALAVAAGGLKAFQDQFATYYDKFYSDTEKQARLQGQLAGQLMAVNMALPDTRDGYRDLVESLDINNAKDRERYSVLIKLAGAADEYYKALADGLDVYKSNIKSAYDTAEGLLKAQVDNYQQAIDQLKGFSDTLFNGPLSTASPVDKYLAAKGDFTEIQRVLKTGTAEQKAAALPNLQGVVQQFLDASRAYNAGSLPYMQDLAAAQALLGKSIGDAQAQKDVAQMQLDRLTDQVTALGLINTSTVSVKTAVDDVGKAINELVKFQAEQAAAQNRARFDAQESARKAAYEAPIANRAANFAASASKSEGRLPWDAGTSRNAFSAQATIDASTGAITGGEAYASSSRHAGDVMDTLKNSGLASFRAQFAHVGGLIEQITGLNLPDVTVRIEAGNDPDPGKESYSFAGYAKTLVGDNPDPLLRLFAADAVDYLAGKIGDEAQAKAMKGVKFDSLPAGINALSTALDTLRKGPYQAQTYDPLKKYAMGGIASTASIFGEAGPEAAVPLPDGRTIPVTISGIPQWLMSPAPSQIPQANGSNADLLQALQDLKRELAELRKVAESQDKHAAASVATQQTGFQKTIASLESQVAALNEQVRRSRIGANA